MLNDNFILYIKIIHFPAGSHQGDSARARWFLQPYAADRGEQPQTWHPMSLQKQTVKTSKTHSFINFLKVGQYFYHMQSFFFSLVLHSLLYWGNASPTLIQDICVSNFFYMDTIKMLHVSMSVGRFSSNRVIWKEIMFRSMGWFLPILISNTWHVCHSSLFALSCNAGT